MVNTSGQSNNEYTDLEGGNLGNGNLGNGNLGNGNLGNGKTTRGNTSHGDGDLGDGLWVGSLEENLNGVGGMGTQALPSEIRVAFIQKIYCLLSLQLLITWWMSFGVYASHSATQFVLHTPGALVVAILGTFLTLFLSWCYGRSYPVNYVILFMFTICESYLVTYVCLFYQPTSILMAWGLTASIFMILSGYVLVTGKDFSFLGAGLFACLWILIIGGLIQVIWLPDDQFLNTVMAVFGAMIACGYILYDTSDILKRLDPDEFVYACMSLYLDIIMLFLRLLELFGKLRD